jgi:hypothetical protein
VQDTTTITTKAVREIIAELAGADRVPEKFNVVTDTSDFFRLEYNDVLAIAGSLYWIKRYEKEGRFGLDDEPKYWVRRAIDLADGATKILKLVFHEQYETKVGGVTITQPEEGGPHSRPGEQSSQFHARPLGNRQRRQQYPHPRLHPRPPL